MSSFWPQQAGMSNAFQFGMPQAQGINRFNTSTTPSIGGVPQAQNALFNPMQGSSTQNALFNPMQPGSTQNADMSWNTGAQPGMANPMMGANQSIAQMVMQLLQQAFMLFQSAMAAVQQAESNLAPTSSLPSTGAYSSGGGSSPGVVSSAANSSGSTVRSTGANQNEGIQGSVAEAVKSGKDVGGNKQAMAKLASAGRSAAGALGTNGYCLRGVNNALEKAGMGMERKGHAYQAASVLAQDKRFKEVKVSRDQLDKLPAGCVIIWDKTAKNTSGHAAITQGNGKETSDHASSLTKLGGGFRVFVPK